MSSPRHWQDPVNACVAVLILFSPWLAGYALVQSALANAVIVGTLLFTVSLAAAIIGRPWVECAVVAMGLWLLASPWALVVVDERAQRAAIGLGGLVLLLGVGALVRDLRRGQHARARRPD